MNEHECDNTMCRYAREELHAVQDQLADLRRERDELAGILDEAQNRWDPLDGLRGLYQHLDVTSLDGAVDSFKSQREEDRAAIRAAHCISGFYLDDALGEFARGYHAAMAHLSQWSEQHAAAIQRAHGALAKKKPPTQDSA